MADLGGRYRLVRRLGAGGMGEVWLAADEGLDDRPVAIKVMHSAMLTDAQDAARFQREMRLAARMNHPNIMTVFTTGTDNGVPFMVMEYLEGSDLSRMPSAWRPDDVAGIGRETCAALAYAHSLSPGVVHRDIKPANLFICASGQVKVTDFGIAKAVSGTRLSATGSWIGTLPYMAPEQWLGEPAAFSNDIWAVGCVLYELLSGRLARSYATPPEYMAAAMRGEPVPPLPAAADVPGWLSDAVMAMLQPAPGDRPAAAQCVQMLCGPAAYATMAPRILAPPTAGREALLVAPPTAGREPASPAAAAAPRARRVSRRRLLVSGAVAVVVGAALAIGYVTTHDGGGHRSVAGGTPGVSASAMNATRSLAPGHSASDHPTPGHSGSGHSGSGPASGNSGSSGSSDSSGSGSSGSGSSGSGSSGSGHSTAGHIPAGSSGQTQQAQQAAAATWTEIGVRQGADLTSVSCAGQDLCAATATGGAIYVYQGSSWSSEASTGNIFGTVTCPSTSYCAAAGYASGGNIFSFNGSSWSAPDLIDPGYKLHSVACVSASFCVAGASVNMFVESGGSWSGPDAVDPNDANGSGVEAVSCASSSFCVAVDAIGNALTYANGSWSAPLGIGNGGQLKSVSCPSTSFCVAVGAGGNAVVYSGGSWSSARNVDGVSLDSVSCTSSSFCMAVDADGAALSYTNGSWSSPHAVSGAGGLDSVSCTSASYCVAVDDLGNSFVRR